MVMMGPRAEMTVSIPTFYSSPSSHVLRPCIETLTPWPWASTEDRRVGNILCDMYLPDGSPDPRCPRQLLKTQLDVLWKNHGLMIKTAFEYEFCIFKENSIEPFNNIQLPYCDLRVWGKHQVLFSELREMLETMGIQIGMIHPEGACGQWELTTEPYLGVHGADVGFYVKNAVKGFLKTKGYDATFMAHPVTGDIKCVNGQQMNHSLWKPSFYSDKEEQNVFVGSDGGLSSTAKHWIAGVLTHANALSALFLPSINCHRFLHLPVTPSFPTWGVDNRKALIRARVLEGNVYLENRLVSGAASPYLTLAGTVAAGLDGLERRLECPAPMDSKQAKEMPRTLDQALTVLQEDQLLADRLGQDFVSCFVNSKRVMEIEPYEKAELKTEEEQIAFERDMYFRIY